MAIRKCGQTKVHSGSIYPKAALASRRAMTLCENNGTSVQPQSL